MKLIFRKEIFVKDMLSEKVFDSEKQILDAHLTTWVVECDGKEVVDGRIGRYSISEDWCEKIEE